MSPITTTTPTVSRPDSVDLIVDDSGAPKATIVQASAANPGAATVYEIQATGPGCTSDCWGATPQPVTTLELTQTETVENSTVSVGEFDDQTVVVLGGFESGDFYIFESGSDNVWSTCHVVRTEWNQPLGVATSKTGIVVGRGNPSSAQFYKRSTDKNGNPCWTSKWMLAPSGVTPTPKPNTCNSVPCTVTSTTIAQRSTDRIR